MRRLPVELIERIIDCLAEIFPESLLDCALVSRDWNPRSAYWLEKIYRHPIIASHAELHAFLDIIKKHPILAGLATTLEIAPETTNASYIPFHHLSSRLPNLRRLIFGVNFRWRCFPVLYSRGTVGSLFRQVAALELCCPFDSVADLFRIVRSFRCLSALRLFRLPITSAPLEFVDDKTHTIARSLFQGRHYGPLHSLEVPVSHVRNLW